MRKFFLWIFVIALLAFSVSAENFTVQDSFDRADATLNGQTADNGNSWSVTGSTVTTYNNEFRSVADDTTQTAYFNLDKQINSSNGWRSAIELQMRTSSTSCKGTVRFRSTGDDEVIYAGMQDYLCDNDNCYIAGDGDNFETLIDPFTLGVNYSFRIGEFNYSALKARTWLNGVDKGLISMKDFPIEKFVFLGGNGCTYYADNITIIDLDGTPIGPPTPPPTPNSTYKNFTITANDIYDDSSLNEFNISMILTQETPDNYSNNSIATFGNINNFFDTNFSTYVRPSVFGTELEIYMNYTIQRRYNQNNTLWEIKSGSRHENISIPKNCWYNTNNTLILRVSALTGASKQNKWYCKNNQSIYETLINDINTIPGNNYSRLYEERIHWGVIANTTTGTLNTEILNYTDMSYSVIVDSTQDGGYYTETYTGNINQNLEANLTKYFRIYNTSYSSNISNGTIDFVRILNSTIRLTCPDFTNTQLIRTINNTQNLVIPLSCNNATLEIKDNYTHSGEGLFNITYLLNTSIANNNQYTTNATFKADLTNPTISYLNITFFEGFNVLTANISVACTDVSYNPILYNVTFNNIQNITTNYTSGYIYTGLLPLVTLNNYLEATCSDLFGTTYDSYNTTAYLKTLVLIDEQTGKAFDVANLSSVKVYYDDNSTFYDFKSNSTHAINFTSQTNNKLRFEFIELDGTTRIIYVDVTLGNQPLRVCAHKEGVSHYEQLITSASEKRAVLTNVFANCVVAADYTRFAYQDSKILRAQTINGFYYLYTWLEGTKTLLASVDGAISTYIQIDQLEFLETAYELDILGDAVSFKKVDDTIVSIYYNNLGQDNDQLDITITNMDTNTQVFTYTETDTPNNLTLLFDYSTLNNVTNNTVFKAEFTTTVGDTQTLTKRYFNINAGVGVLSTGIALVLSFLLLIFGFTLTASRITFSWFGIIISIIAIGVLSIGISAWYTIFLQAIEFIVLVYVVILTFNKNYQTVA